MSDYDDSRPCRACGTLTDSGVCSDRCARDLDATCRYCGDRCDCPWDTKAHDGGSCDGCSTCVDRPEPDKEGVTA
jgi:hypothetical protein